MCTGRLFPYVVHSKRVAGIENMFRHRATHVTQSDKTNSHSLSPFLSSPTRYCSCRYHSLVPPLAFHPPLPCHQLRYTVITILPKWAALSIYLSASRVSANGKMRSITGLVCWIARALFMASNISREPA